MRRSASKFMASAAHRVALVSFMSLACASCHVGKGDFALSGPTMGTTYHVKIRVQESGLFAHGKLVKQVQSAIDDVLAGIDEQMSTYRDSSEISRLNSAPANTPIAVSADLFSVFQTAGRISEESGGAFDITVGPLVNAWGFGPKKSIEPKEPTGSELADLLDLVGFQKLTLNAEGKTIAKMHASTYCDLNSIAPGYAVDKVALALDALSIEHYMVEIGGEVRAKGLNEEGQPWQIAIEKPTLLPEQQIETVVPLSGMSLATSGDYRNFIEIDGQRFSHTIDPKSGRPVTHKLASVTVITKECVDADGYATAIMAMGPEAGMAMAERLKLSVYMILHSDDGQYRVETSSAFQQQPGQSQ
ncbi:MAG: FAD:protein FMN transferase [Candidatus Hydrogenedentota bacterium]